MRNPVVRVGLKTDARSVTLGLNGRGYASADGRAHRVGSQIVLGPSHEVTVRTLYSAQVESFSAQENARKAMEELKRRTRRPVFVYYNPDRNLHQLRVGPVASKEEAQKVVQEMKSIGYSSAFYVSEDSTQGGPLPDLVVRDEFGSVILKTSSPVRVWADDLTVRVDQETYRGYASVFVNRTGRITVINVVNFEDYVKGVVPNEIGGGSTQTFEALKAQAVAARTYAYKNLRQFEQDGYDLCATPRCQVYSGTKNESELSEKAVEETQGEILMYAGEPINAMYTSTCGGRTENVEFMFENMNAPYLKSVRCYPEESQQVPASVVLEGRRQPWWLSWVNAKLGTSYSGNLDLPLESEEASSGVADVMRYLGKTPCGPADPSDTGWIAIGDYLVSQLCWQAKRDSLLTEKDYQYFLSHLNFSLDPRPETHSFLFLFHDGILVPDSATLNRFNPYLSMKRRDFYFALYRVLDHYHQINPSKGYVREVRGREIQVVDDTGVHLFELQTPAYLYQILNEEKIEREDLACSPGDRAEYFVVEGKIRILACELNQTGAAVDRSSKYSFWQENVTPSELGKRVSRYADVGDVQDLQPLSYGVSGRVYEMKITGTRNVATMTGIRVRWALGLRDNLFTVDRTLGKDGRVSEFVFSGRGWGHGVGMCQVGALGYARQGKSYRDILLHYYSGVTIDKLW